MDDSPNSSMENDKSQTWQTSKQRKLYYRELLNKVEAIEEREDVDVKAIEEIGEIIKDVNLIENEHNIDERHKFPEEILLDSMVLSSVSNVLVKCVKAVDVNAYTYKPTELSNQIISFCQGDDDFEEDSLLNLLADAQHIIPEVPDYNYVYGTYDMQNLPQPKQKKERVKKQKETFQKKEPEKVTNVQSDEKGIDEIVKVLYDVLTLCYEKNNEEAIKYYDYVVDTSSFSNTVENMFYCAFLIRDGRAHITIDGKGVPYIKPMKKRQLKRFREDGGFNSQIISVITVSEWEMYKKPGYIQKFKSAS